METGVVDYELYQVFVFKKMEYMHFDFLHFSSITQEKCFVSP